MKNIIYTNSFLNILYDLENNKDFAIKKIANFLINVKGTDIDKLLQNYIGLSDSPDKVTFIQNNKIDNKVVLRNSSLSTNSNVIKNLGLVNKKGLFNSSTCYKNLIYYIDLSNLEDIKADYFTTDNNDYSKTSNIKIVNSWSIDRKIEHNGYTYFLLKNIENSDLQIIISGYSRDILYGTLPFDYDYQYLDTLSKNEIKIGRFVNKIIELYFTMKSTISLDFGDSIKTLSKSDFTQADVEKFVNVYTSDMLYNSKVLNNFKVVSGKDIKYWYSKKTYENNKGQLGNSCMRYSRCSSYFKIYTKNPDVCQLLTLTNDKNELIGRALLWTDINGNKWMDRVYTNKDSLIELFYKWGKENGFNKLNGGEWSVIRNVKVKIKSKDYKQYPYLDTLIYYDKKEGLLNVITNDIDGKYYELNDTDGDYETYHNYL